MALLSVNAAVSAAYGAFTDEQILDAARHAASAILDDLLAS